MKIEPKPSDREVLAGLVERVTFHNEENGFCVLRIKARGQRELITVVGLPASGSRRQANGSMTAPMASSSRQGFLRPRNRLRSMASKSISGPG